MAFAILARGGCIDKHGSSHWRYNGRELSETRGASMGSRNKDDLNQEGPSCETGRRHIHAGSHQ